MNVNTSKPKSWTIKHPSGHVYVINDLTVFLRVHHKTQKELEEQGWSFSSRTVKPKPAQ
jgi:hypothetical protein